MSRVIFRGMSCSNSMGLRQSRMGCFKSLCTTAPVGISRRLWLELPCFSRKLPPHYFQPGSVPQGTQGQGEKPPDVTMLYHLKGTGAPDATTMFSASLDENFGQVKDWHWAIVSARGVP